MVYIYSDFINDDCDRLQLGIRSVTVEEADKLYPGGIFDNVEDAVGDLRDVLTTWERKRGE